MKAGQKLKAVLMIIVLAGILAVVVWAFMQGRKEASTEKREAPAGAPPRVSVQDGETVITLDKEIQARSGIAVEPLKPISHREEIRAYGSVLELQSLVDLRRTLIDLRRTLVDLLSGYAMAKAQVEQNRANLAASSKQYERQKVLYEEDQNASARTFQAAEAAWLSDQAGFRAAQEALNASQKSIEAAEESLHALEDGARQQWGPVATRWLFENTSAYQRLIRQQDLLIQITLPAGMQVSSGPESVRVQTASGTVLSANLVSTSPRTDPRIQGMSFFYMAPAQAGFLPGMNVLAYLAFGAPVEGFLVPASAVVWWQGRAWVYVQKDEDQFVRREISSEAPVKEGFFVRKGFSAEDRVVVKGAQLLLSIEARGEEGGRKEGGEQE